MPELAPTFRGSKVLVTGGAGLLGSAFVQMLLEAGAEVRTVHRRRPIPFSDMEVMDGDLRLADDCLRACRGVRAVVHAAGVGGGSKAITTLHGISMFTDNLLMTTQVLEAARLAGAERCLLVSSSSVYPKSDRPLREEDAWGDESFGVPEIETGMAKRASETQCAFYARLTGMAFAIIRTANAYGPFDNFDLEAAHVVPALIHKAVDRMDPYPVWGSGENRRDYVHTHDIAAAGLLALAQADPGDCRPVNVGTGTAHTVRQLVSLILEETGHANARVEWEPNAPPTAAIKLLDLARMRELGFQPRYTLEDGLRQTIEWYRSHSLVS